MEDCEEKEEISIRDFKAFNVVSDFSDHHFSQSEQPDYGNQKVNRYGLKRRILKEWEELEECPESIFVRGYEDRIDLLRAVIVGVEGTPYSNGLFFFDLKIPDEYSRDPVKVHYRSYGLHINPNFDVNDDVCPSLFNPFTVISKVLISIQALILNQIPYYSIDRELPRHYEKKALLYNADVFLLNCKTMLHVLSSPPMHFEEFVSLHFRNHAQSILTACKAFMESSNVYGSPSSSSIFQSMVVSKKSKASMEELYPKLIGAFVKTGASLDDFLEEFRLEKEKAFHKPKTIQRAKNWLAKTSVTKLKVLVGEKKDELLEGLLEDSQEGA